MPTTAGNVIRTVADIIQVLTKCTKEQADIYEEAICNNYRAKAILLSACGIATAGVGVGGRLILAGTATGGSTIPEGIIIMGASAYAAKKACRVAINIANHNIKIEDSGD